jgi:hypothetical protein
MTRRRRTSWILVPVLVVGSAITAVATGATPALADSPTTRQVPSAGLTQPRAGTTGSGAIQWPEFPGGTVREDEGAKASAQATTKAGSHPAAGLRTLNRHLSGRSGHGSAAGSSSNQHSATLRRHFDGLNFRDQRTANGGNQFSVEPPDQGLCVGNGFVLETVNDVLRVFDTHGNALTGVVDQNTFYGYPPAINRTTGVFGPFVTDPSCYYDRDVRRWFHVVLTLEVDPASGDFLGPNHLDLAVSNTADPTKAWTIYRLPVQDDGTQGTPNHHCEGGPCIGDYPHIGADAHGFFITTNEYPFFADGFVGAQVYAFSKRALASLASAVTVVQFDTSVGSGHDLAGTPGFTVWPATSPSSAYSNEAHGTEYFLSSTAAEEANGTGTSNTLGLWAVSNTRSLDTSSPSVVLNNRVLSVRTYSIPPKANQKAGPFPLGQCLNSDPCATVILGAPDPFKPEVLSDLDANDSRMQQVVYANGKVWGSLDTAVNQKGVTKAGVSWFIVSPRASLGAVHGKVRNEGRLGLKGNNLTYPAVSALNNGKGIISFTVVGDDFYPSVGYASIDPAHGVGKVRIAQQGAGPQDGFSGYKAFGNPPGTTRPRWGDYGASVPDGNSIWFAAEYIAQTCTLAEYQAAPFGSCGGTRAALGNWATHIAQVTP